MEQTTKGALPAYKGDGVAVWLHKDKNGKTYLSIKLLGSINVRAFKNEPKPQAQQINEEAGWPKEEKVTL